VLPALQEAVILKDLTFGQRDVLVGAAVTDGIDIVRSTSPLCRPH